MIGTLANLPSIFNPFPNLPASLPTLPATLPILLPTPFAAFLAAGPIFLAPAILVFLICFAPNLETFLRFFFAFILVRRCFAAALRCPLVNFFLGLGAPGFLCFLILPLAPRIMNAAKAASINGIFFCMSARLPSKFFCAASSGSVPNNILTSFAPAPAIHITPITTGLISIAMNLPIFPTHSITNLANPNICGRYRVNHPKNVTLIN